MFYAFLATKRFLVVMDNFTRMKNLTALETLLQLGCLSHKNYLAFEVNKDLHPCKKRGTVAEDLFISVTNSLTTLYA